MENRSKHYTFELQTPLKYERQLVMRLSGVFNKTMKKTKVLGQ